MKRIFLAVLSLLILMILTGCGGDNTTPTQAGVTALPDIATIVAQTLAAVNTASPTVSQPSPSTATYTPAAPTGTSISTATPQIASPTIAATNTPTESPATSTTTPTAVPSPDASPMTAATTPAGMKTSDSTASTSTNASSSTADCIDKAGFFTDVTVPDNTLLPANTEFTKTWRFRNEGTCTWGEGYQVVFADGQIMSGPPFMPLPKAAPGELVDVTVNLKTPSEGGTYAGDWEFENPNGKRFGVNSHGEDMFWVIIKVDWGPGVGPTATPPPVNCVLERNAGYEAQILQLINTARAANRLAALTLQSQLSAAAEGHSADMACNSYLDHTGSDKSSHSSRLKAQGYKYSYESENIYAGGNAQDAFDWWMNSPVHRANILSSKVTQIGIGFAYFASSQYGGYYTLDFAHP